MYKEEYSWRFQLLAPCGAHLFVARWRPMIRIGIIFKPINSRTNEPILINFFLKESRFFSLQIFKRMFCSNFTWKIIYSDSKNHLKFHYAMKIFPRSNFEKNSSHICRETILVYFLKKVYQNRFSSFEFMGFKNFVFFQNLSTQNY